MNKKIIEDMLTKKFNHWVNSITDENVKKLVKDNTIITGGCIVSMLENNDINDYDIYFTNKETVKEVAKYYVKLFNNRKNNRNAFVVDGSISLADQDDENKTVFFLDEISYNEIPEDRIKICIRNFEEDVFDTKENEPLKNYTVNHNNLIENKNKTENGKYFPVFLTENAITLSDKIQIVIRFYGDAEEIHSNFDYVHCTNYWKSSNKKLYLNKDALESIITKQLYYTGSKYPLCSIFRSRKFIKRGWHINAGQFLKMAIQLNELNLKDICVLRDQLVGVDTLYFIDLLSRIEKRKKEDPNFIIDDSFIISLVDEIF